MSIYSKINKETAIYTKSTKADTEKGWFKQGWFSNWFKGDLYRKVTKALSTYTKIK